MISYRIRIGTAFHLVCCLALMALLTPEAMAENTPSGAKDGSAVVTNNTVQADQTNNLPSSTASLDKPPSRITVDWQAPLKLTASVVETKKDSDFVEKLLPGLISLVSIIVACVSLFYSQKNVSATFAQKANEAELQDIQNKLDSFYGPFVQLSETNKLMIQELRSRQPDPTKFRTLTLLIDPKLRSNLSKSDAAIVDQIVANDDALDKLIHSKSGLVNFLVSPYLARASTHFRVMQLAHSGKLENDASRFNLYVYPRQLDEVLRLEVARLRTRADELRRDLGRRLEPAKDLSIPSASNLPPWPGK